MKRMIYSLNPVPFLPDQNNIVLTNKSDVIDVPDGRVFYLEDLDKKNTWLEINTVIDFDRDNLIIAGASKYYKLTSKKTNYLHMLTEKTDSVFIVDYLFSCNGLENLFNPISYIDRRILGYQHWYAWRENYQEVFQGQTLSAFDPMLIHHKIKDYVAYDLKRVKRKSIALDIDVSSYEAKRDALFEDQYPPNRLVTTLSDFVTRMPGRVHALKQWINNNVIGKPALVFNIRSNQKAYRKIIKNADYFTYNDTDIKNDTVIYAEPILVKEYLMDRIEQLNPDAEYIHVFDNTKVSAYLKQKVFNHVNDNDSLKKYFENETD